MIRAGELLQYLIKIYARRRVPRSAAELSYYLTLSIFPVLIVVYALLRGLFPDVTGIFAMIDDALPANISSAIYDYMVYVESHSDSAMLIAGVLMTATTSAACFRGLHNILGDIRGERRFAGVPLFFLSFLFSPIAVLAICASAVIMVTGNWFLEALNRLFPAFQISLAWGWVRYLLLFGILLAFIYGLYLISTPVKERSHLLPGALIADAALVLVSIIFSWLIDKSVRYPLVYGTLSSIVILMFWIYICSIVVIMGCAVNVYIQRKREYGAPENWPVT